MSTELVRQPAEFETAIAATKFGKFNILLLFATVPCSWSAVFDTGSMSYVFPAAQCDLNLTLANKGQLNACIFVGKSNSSTNLNYFHFTINID